MTFQPFTEHIKKKTGILNKTDVYIKSAIGKCYEEKLKNIRIVKSPILDVYVGY
jgi:hypothetical protein